MPIKLGKWKDWNAQLISNTGVKFLALLFLDQWLEIVCGNDDLETSYANCVVFIFFSFGPPWDLMGLLGSDSIVNCAFLKRSSKEEPVVGIQIRGEDSLKSTWYPWWLIWSRAEPGAVDKRWFLISWVSSVTTDVVFRWNSWY